MPRRGREGRPLRLQLDDLDDGTLGHADLSGGEVGEVGEVCCFLVCLFGRSAGASFHMRAASSMHTQPTVVSRTMETMTQCVASVKRWPASAHQQPEQYVRPLATIPSHFTVMGWLSLWLVAKCLPGKGETFHGIPVMYEDMVGRPNSLGPQT